MQVQGFAYVVLCKAWDRECGTVSKGWFMYRVV